MGIFSLAASPDTGSPAGMLFSCWAIIIVLLLMSFSFLRASRKGYAIAILPLLIPPFIYVFSGVTANLLDRSGGFSATELRIFFILTASLISCLLLGSTSRQIPGKKTRLLFFWCCAAFVIILTLVLIGNTMSYLDITG